MRRFAMAVIAGVCCALVAGASTALADGPTKIPLPAPSHQVLIGSCSFPVVVDVLVNDEFGIFFDTYFIVAGRLVYRLTHGAVSLVENISGPAKIVPHSDGTVTVYGRGAGLVPSPGHLWLATGNSVVEVAADGTQILVSTSGTVQDLCGALS